MAVGESALATFVDDLAFASIPLGSFFGVCWMSEGEKITSNLIVIYYVW